MVLAGRDARLRPLRHCQDGAGRSGGCRGGWSQSRRRRQRRPRGEGESRLTETAGLGGRGCRAGRSAAGDELSGFGAPRHSAPRVPPPLSGRRTALQALPASRAGASGEVSAGAAARTAVACGAVTARSGDSVGSEMWRGWPLPPLGGSSEPGCPSLAGSAPGGAVVLRAAPAPLRRQLGVSSVFVRDFLFRAGLGLLLGGGGGGGERGGPGAGILTSSLRKTEVASRNPTCSTF